ncbi:glycosyl transferase, partial [Yersinia sp. 2542 StPb PI]
MHEDKSSIGDNNSLKIGIIHLITEGVQLFVGGVGSYIRGQIMALPEVIKLLADNNISLEPHFI